MERILPDDTAVEYKALKLYSIWACFAFMVAS
jgi:hypothetical protein